MLFRKLAPLVAVLVSAACTSHAQTITGSVVGTVTDPSNNVIVGANVTLINEGTVDQRTATTDSTGGFAFQSVLPGSYTVRVESQGFQRYERKSNVISANERNAMGNIQLTIGSLTESISVVASGERVQVASSESSALLNTRQIDTLAQKGRVLYNYLLIIPGVSTNAGGADAASGFLTQPNAGGLPNTMMTMSVDGMQGQDNGSTQLYGGNVAPDAVEEIKVLMNNYQAEYGRNGGATVTVITKSGTKDFHGSAYWFKRHEEFNSGGFFNNRSSVPKPVYRFLTKGVTIGGPIMIPKLFNTRKEKLFFFYNYDGNPSRTAPATPALQTLPTSLERSGDFSQSLNPSGKMIVVNDPTTKAPFPNNIIPSYRINKNGQILLNFMPLPNQLNRAITGGAYNNTFLNVSSNTRNEHLFRVDFKATDKDSLYFRGTYFHPLGIRSALNSFDGPRNSYGSPIKTAVFGWTRLISPTMVNEFTAGVKRALEQTRIDDDLTYRKTWGFTAGQFAPGINYWDQMPGENFGAGSTGLQNMPNFGNYQAGRFPQMEADINYYINNSYTITRPGHTFKFGIYAERDRITTGTGFGTTPTGAFVFTPDVNNPLDTGHPFANALIGNFTSYTESTTRTRPAGVGINIDWFVQDSWKVSRRLTLEIGMRVAYFTPWHFWSGLGTDFALDRYNPANAPVLYRPACIGASPCSGVNRVAVNPLTGQTIAIGALLTGPSFVPGTGDPANGSITAKDPNYPHGFIENNGEMFQPRFGFAWDVFGNGKTAVRGGFGVANQIVRYEPQAALAPINYTPTYYYGNLDTFLNTSGYLSPGQVIGFDRHGKAPTIYNISFGVQQSIGFGTVLDVKYVSTLARHLATNQAINNLPYGTRFLPTSIDPTTNTVYNDNYLRPYPGYSTITERTRLGSSNYHALQVQANRRFARGVQFGVAYTYSKAQDYYGNGSQATGAVTVAGPTGANYPVYMNPRVWAYTKSGFDQTHTLTFSYTYNLPQVSKLAPHPVTRFAFDNWEVSGITTFASGVPNNVSLSTSLDLAGGGDGVRLNLTGDPRIARDQRGFLQMFNPSVFAIPSKGDPGNIGNGIVRGPGINNWDLTMFKNFPLKSEQRSFQFRWEFYNLYNHTQFNTMNTTATFSSAGVMNNTSLGQATGNRPARIMQLSLKFKF